MLAALGTIMAFCKAMIERKQDPQGSYATAQEICKQLIALGEEALGRMLQRMNYISEILARAVLPSIGDFKEFLNKVAQIVNCDVKPFVPEGWKVVEHIKGGKWEWDPSKVLLYLSDGQKGGERIEGNKLREELKGKSVLNANVLDFLLANPLLIPEEWKGKAVFFWGTVYRNADGNLVVRYLYWNGTRWHWGYSWLAYDWIDLSPAALSTSN